MYRSGIEIGCVSRKYVEGGGSNVGNVGYVRKQEEIVKDNQRVN